MDAAAADLDEAEAALDPRLATPVAGLDFDKVFVDFLAATRLLDLGDSPPLHKIASAFLLAAFLAAVVFITAALFFLEAAVFMAAEDMFLTVVFLAAAVFMTAAFFFVAAVFFEVAVFFEAAVFLAAAIFLPDLLGARAIFAGVYVELRISRMKIANFSPI